MGGGGKGGWEGFGLLVNSINYNNQRHVSSAAQAAKGCGRGLSLAVGGVARERGLANCPMLMTSRCECACVCVGVCVNVCVFWWQTIEA